MYKEASQLKLRFETSKGLLSVEQLWDLSLPELDRLAVKYEDEYKASGKKSFLVKKNQKDKVLKLQSDIVVDILTTLVEAQENARTALENKNYNQKILNLIAEKEESDLKNLSADELRKLIKK